MLKVELKYIAEFVREKYIDYKNWNKISASQTQVFEDN